MENTGKENEESGHLEMNAKLDLLLDKITGLERKTQMLEELVDESMPIALEAMGAINEFAQEAIEKGYLHFAQMLIRVIDASVPRWSHDEIDRLGEHMSSMMSAMMQMSEPKTLLALEKAGMLTVMKDLSRKEVREGLAFLTHFLYLAHPGRGNEAYGKNLNKHNEGYGEK